LALGRDVLGIAPEEATLASILRESGFATAAFSAANPYISSRFGYDQGFDVFADFLQDPDSLVADTSAGERFRGRANRMLAEACHSMGFLGAAYDELYFQYCQKLGTSRSASLDSLRKFPSADVIVDRALAWLKENSRGRFFLWLHLMDPHGPYFPKTEALKMIGADEVTGQQALYLNSYWNRGDISNERLQSKKNAVVNLYDAGIRWADEQIRRLSESLVELNLWNNCTLTVSADHGEEFLEHGGRYHVPRKLTQELVHVPLLMRVPGTSQTNVAPPFSMLDLAPTLLDVMGIPSPAEFRGRSRWSEVRKNKTQARPIVAECVHDCANPFHPQGRVGPRVLAVRLNQYKLVVNFSTGSEDLYDLDHDPEEREPLPRGHADDIRVALLKHARRHLVESSQSRDFDKRIASRVRDFRLELARPAVSTSTN
ncbi:MAG TPA: sulfatase-like hydrolase/transferase, partial [Terriglobales bacterium]